MTHRLDWQKLDAAGWIFDDQIRFDGESEKGSQAG